MLLILFNGLISIFEFDLLFAKLSLLFRLLYGNEDYLSNIIVTDLESTDNTRKILNHLQDDYDFIKVANWKECKDIIDNVKTN